MTTVITRKQSARISRNPTIPPASLQEISDQWCFSEVRDDEKAPNNGETLKDSQPSHKGKERADPPSSEPSNIPRDPNDLRNFGGNPGDDDPDSLDDGDDDPDHVPSTTPTTHAPDALTQLLNVINWPTNTESKAKVHKPEVYNGTDQAKLHTFFLQCYINFCDCPSTFQTGSAKIQYAISYLSGSALQYFEPAILSEVTPKPVWLRDWDVFKDELQMNFSPYNNAAQAEIELKKIIMKEHHKVARYFIAFSRASTWTQWNDVALRHFAYKGLAKRIKDNLMHFPRYQSLAELCNFALEIDSRYWERKEYKSIGSNPQSSSNNTTSGNRSTQNQGSTNQGSNNSNNQGSNNLNSGKKKKSQAPNDSGTNNTADKPTKTLTDTLVKLRKDGKLLPEERQRWIDQGLCLLCGQKGHRVKDCPKATQNSSNSKGQAAKTSDSKVEAPASTSASKK
jgi:Retrotransposon gag protein